VREVLPKNCPGGFCVRVSSSSSSSNSSGGSASSPWNHLFACSARECVGMLVLGVCVLREVVCSYMSSCPFLFISISRFIAI
jgi:hypothetical protein